MKVIISKRGDEFIVDDDWYDFLNRFKWVSWRASGRIYASLDTRIDGVRTSIMMHRVVASCPNGLLVDHINHNSQDNRSCNLRICNKSQNAMNRSGLAANNTSGHAGVYFNKDCRKWQAYITVLGRTSYLGIFVDINDAISARLRAEQDRFREYQPRHEKLKPVEKVTYVGM